MVWGINEVTSRLGIDGSTAANRQIERSEPASLFTCPECDRTYVCREMETCASCKVSVERVPNERELGII